MVGTIDTKKNEVKQREKQREEQATAQGIDAPSKSFGLLLRDCLVLLNLGVISKDPRIIGRMLRRVSTLRQLFRSDIYIEAVRVLLLPASQKRAELLLECIKDVQPCKPAATKNHDIDMIDAKQLSEPQQPPAEPSSSTSDEDVDMSNGLPSPSTSLAVVGSVKEFDASIGDVDLFLSTLAMMLLIDNRLSTKALPLASSIVKTLSLYPPPHKYDGLVLGKALFYSYRIYELEGQTANLKGFLMDIYRTSVLHRQTTAQLEKAPYPEGLRSNAQHARYLYYLARINAVRLDYGEAYSKVIQAIRKAPQEGSLFGKGFRLASHKLCFVIQLLMGDIPDRRLFNQKDLRVELIPYAKIVQAVRSGGLASFKRVMVEQEQTFIKDGNIDLIQRLHHNVIRAGLRKISASYSAISLDDVASKLGLDVHDDTECIVSKAIADCVIDATVEFETKTVYSKSQGDKLVPGEPCKAFHGRIAFCLQLYNEALKAMQYPEAEGDSKIEEAEARRKEHQEQLARAEKDEFESGDDGDF